MVFTHCAHAWNQTCVFDLTSELDTYMATTYKLYASFIMKGTRRMDFIHDHVNNYAQMNAFKPLGYPMNTRVGGS